MASELIRRRRPDRRGDCSSARTGGGKVRFANDWLVELTFVPGERSNSTCSRAGVTNVTKYLLSTWIYEAMGILSHRRASRVACAGAAPRGLNESRTAAQESRGEV